MTTYHASGHAVLRLGERFPALVQAVGAGRQAAAWLERVAIRAQVAGQQAGMDLLLSVDVPTAAGPARLYLPVTPRLGQPWIIRTVLTAGQAEANLAHRADLQRAAWRARKRFTRPYLRRARRATALTEAA